MKNLIDDWPWADDNQNPNSYGNININIDDRLGLAKAFSRCFSGIDGDLALGHLRKLTLERALSPEVDNNGLRHLEGQRQLVLYIVNLITRGLA